MTFQPFSSPICWSADGCSILLLPRHTHTADAAAAGHRGFQHHASAAAQTGGRASRWSPGRPPASSGRWRPRLFGSTERAGRTWRSPTFVGCPGRLSWSADQPGRQPLPPRPRIDRPQPALLCCSHIHLCTPAAVYSRPERPRRPSCCWQVVGCETAAQLTSNVELCATAPLSSTERASVDAAVAAVVRKRSLLPLALPPASMAQLWLRLGCATTKPNLRVRPFVTRTPCLRCFLRPSLLQLGGQVDPRLLIPGDWGTDAVGYSNGQSYRPPPATSVANSSSGSSNHPRL